MQMRARILAAFQKSCDLVKMISGLSGCQNLFKMFVDPRFVGFQHIFRKVGRKMLLQCEMRSYKKALF